ncbi:AMP-binding protein [Chitinophaga sp. G-6-1-13]|uniref:AMP-binding protein n=1 Tax=Chitinophaga fulva TaxID=2728842 RepID=A0A848GI23_9BACT|nr:thioester reductase domain-containing protein [Chitinophaga fulva]NML37866.1 AMP-binding protein [Chitinophaga fulva]
MSVPHLNLVSLFTSTCIKWPDTIAVRDAARSLTYQQTWLYAQDLAIRLRKHGISVGDRVACVSRKDVESIVGFWGILLCGAIPVMLDEEDGTGVNITKMMEVQAAAVLLDLSRYPAPEPWGNIPLLDLAACCNHMPSGTQPEMSAVPTVPDTCYILLTSGTTGKPKAVQIRHSNVLHYAEAIYELLGRPEYVVAAHVSTFAADLGLTNLLVALMAGGTLRLMNKTEATDPAVFRHIIETEGVSVLKITPSHLLSLINHQQHYEKPVSHLVLGGEKLSWDMVGIIMGTAICQRLYNHYGPTETTIGALAFPVPADASRIAGTGSVPLGMPLGSGICFLENKQDDTGELYIGGPGVSAGYLNNEAENEKRFHVREIAGEKIRCYKTGDICKQLDDGSFEFLYRKDRQVKIMGHRVELGEIELAIYARPEVANVIADISTHPGHPVVEAYVQLHDHARLTSATLKRWLQERLPKYKIPAVFNFYTTAPYNANGKVDFPKLKASFKKENKSTITTPEQVGEIPWKELVGQTWSKILGRNATSPDENFFEAGGDSLLAIQLIGRLQRSGFKISISDIIGNPEYGKFLELEPVKELPGSTPVMPVKTTFPLTVSQAGLLEQKHLDVKSYCQGILLQATGKVAVRELSIALKCLTEGHPQLTSSFYGLKARYGGLESPQGHVHLRTTVLDPERPVVLQVQEVAALLTEEVAAGNRLFVVHLFIDDNGKDYIYFLAHHLLVDVVSWHIILNELLDCYEQLLTGSRPVMPAEDALERFFSQAADKKTDKFPVPGAIPSLPVYRLPVHHIGHTDQPLVEVLYVSLPEDISAALMHFDQQGDASGLTGLLLYAFTGALLDTYAVPILTIDTEYHGRPRHDDLPDLSRSVAWWATTWPVTVKRSRLSVHYCAEMVRENAAIANNYNLFWAIAGKKGREKAPDVRLNYLGHFPESFSNQALTLVPADFNPGSPRSVLAQQEYRIALTARFIGTRLVADIQYQPHYCPADMARAIAANFFDRLKSALKKQQYVFRDTTLPFMKSNIPSVGQPLYNLSPAILPPEKKCVFLTGATGFLGVYLLEQLLEQGTGRIYCLVRDSEQLPAAGRLKNAYEYYFGHVPRNWDQRVGVLPGDLSEHHFGLSEQDYRMLSEEADVILHAGADVNLLREYNRLTKTNICGTRQVITLAATGKQKKIHFVSTLAVSGMPATGGKKRFGEDDFDYGQTFISNYERTKFEAEKLIREYMAGGGQVCIYRVSHIAADSRSGRFQQNNRENRIFQVLKGILLLQQAPDNYREEVSFSHVDIIAQAIVAFSLDKIAPDGPCMHLENPQCFSMTAIVQLLRQMGYRIAIVDAAAFNRKLASYEGPAGNRKEVELMNIWMQRSLQTPRQIIYDSKKSIDLLAKYGIYFPKMDMQWFTAMMQENIRSGYFDLPAGHHIISNITDALREIQQ